VARSAQTLVTRLLALSALALAAWPRAQSGPVRRRRILWGAVVLAGAAVAVFVGSYDTPSYYALVPVAFVVFALGAAVVPTMATLVVPARLGAVLLGAWAVGAAAWLPSNQARGQDVGLLALALLGAALLVAFLARPAARPAAPGRS